MSEGRAKSSSFIISTMKDFSIFTGSDSPLLKGGFAQDGKLNFLSEIQLSEKSGQLSI